MKALSIKQPWASLIAHGIKDIENRTWKTHFRGKIYIHASAKEVGCLSEVLNHIQFSNVCEIWNSDYFPNRPLSAIIGEVDIVDCVINHPSIWAEQTDFSQEDPQTIWNWVLSNPVLYEKPTLNVKGKLSFWDPTPNQKCMVCDKGFFGQDVEYCCSGRDCGCMGQPVEPVVCSEECYNEVVIRNHKRYL